MKKTIQQKVDVLLGEAVYDDVDFALAMDDAEYLEDQEAIDRVETTSDPADLASFADALDLQGREGIADLAKSKSRSDFGLRT
jgi:hypothetical protein